MPVRRRLRSFLIRCLLLPVMPSFMWGPVTHPYIAYQAYRKAREDRSGSVNPVIMEAIDRHKDTYIYAANSPDAISTNHVLFNIIIYDYAHNNMPDEPDGTPAFGYRLVAKALERLRKAPRDDRHRYEKELAFACGWLTHQVSDWVAHYREVEREIGPGRPYTFRGYANSHQVLSPCFHYDILVAKREAEHALTETLHDAHIMFTDTTDLFGPGKVRAELPINEDDNLISLVSETFASLGCSKIPSKHLKKLQEDFEVVIGGIQSGILFVKHMQPKLEDVVKEFAESNQGYIDESVDRVIDLVLSLAEEQIVEESNKVERTCGAATAASVVSIRPESIIHKLAFGLGKAIPPTAVDMLFADPMVRVRWDVPVLPEKYDLDVEIHLRDRVRKLLPVALERFGGRSESTRALVRFASELISASSNVMERARDEYCTNLHPVTALDIEPDHFGRGNSDAELRRMINEGVIRIRFTPAKRTDKESTQYLLDADTAIIRINGYLPGEANAPFTAQSYWDETGEILKYEIRLKEEARRGECIHLFADINDRRPEHSQYIDKQIKLEA